MKRSGLAWRRALVAAALGGLAALPWRAAAYDGQPLDGYSGILVAPGRVAGLGGAVVGLGDDASSLTVNPAAAAVRSRHSSSPLEFGGFLTWILPTQEQLGTVRYTTDQGALEATLGSAGEVLVGGDLQLGRFGVALELDGWSVEYEGFQGDRHVLGHLDLTAGAGVRLCEEQLAVGASLTFGVGRLLYQPATGGEAKVRYGSFGPRFGALLAPRGLPFRVGVAYGPGWTSRPKSGTEGFPVTYPRGLVKPWEVSLGGSIWIGPNAARFNAAPPVTLAAHPEWDEAPPLQAGRPSPLLLTAQLDLVGAAPGAVSSDAVARQTARPSGRTTSLVPRVGAEWEALRHWAILRGGSYLQPGRTGGPSRPHATFGVEGRVPFWPIDLSLTFGGDVAEGYYNVGLSLGFWGDVGPVPRGT